MRRVLGAPGPVGARRKADGSLLTARDRLLQTELARTLRELGSRDPLLGEEMTPELQRQVAGEEAYWCLDPLDGTTNFAAGVPFFGTALAFIRAGRVESALVYDPARDECFVARSGGGAFVNGRKIVPSARERPLSQDVACVDFKRLDKTLAARLAQAPPYASQRNLGACAIEWCWTALGRFGLYLHGGQRLWDYAAGALILLEAGGVVESLDGSPWRGEVSPGDAGAKRAFAAAPGAEAIAAWRSWHADLIGT